MSESALLDVTGRLRSPPATPGFWAGCAPPNKGLRYPADPPTVEEIILVMREAGPGPYADRIRGLIAILWRAGLRISEALALTESDLDPKTGSVLVRIGKVGKGGKRRMVGMDDWGWEHVGRWTEHRIQLPVGPLFCILAGPTRGRCWSATAAHGELRRLAAQAGVRRRFAPHQLRHAHANQMAHEGIPLPIIQRQLGHAHLGITSIHLQGIDKREIVETATTADRQSFRRAQDCGHKTRGARDRRIARPLPQPDSRSAAAWPLSARSGSRPPVRSGARSSSNSSLSESPSEAPALVARR